MVITDVDNPITTATAISTAIVADAPKTATCTNQVSSQFFAGCSCLVHRRQPVLDACRLQRVNRLGRLTPPTPGIITANATGGFDVNGMHSYTSTGPFTVTTTINDPGGSPVTASCTFLIGAATAGGSFVVGDLNAAGQLRDLLGRSVGEGELAERRAGHFKGFSSSPSTNPACGQASIEPGSPPAVAPATAFIIVRGQLDLEDGSTITGNTPQLVVVQVNPGYAGQSRPRRNGNRRRACDSALSSRSVALARHPIDLGSSRCPRRLRR